MEQVYEPTVIADIPFPQDQPVVPTVSQTSGNQTYGQATITDTPLPNPVIAQELLSTALNTRSKKIVQQFQFAPTGALQIGDFTQGVNGDIRISPNGITARDLAGNTTFDLDGDTGEAIFQGKVQAADFVIADEHGLVSAANFQSDAYAATDTLTYNGAAPSLISGSTLTLTLVRPARILFTFFANVQMDFIDATRGYHTNVWIDIDGDGGNTLGYAQMFSQGIANSSSGIIQGTCLSFSRTALLTQGLHTFGLHWAAFTDSTVIMTTRAYDYCMLGS